MLEKDVGSPAFENRMDIIQTDGNKNRIMSRWANKIDHYLVLCIYEQGKKNDIHAADGLDESLLKLQKQSNANSFVIWNRVYRESETLFINLRIAARNQIITHIATIIVAALHKKYEDQLRLVSQRTANHIFSYDRERALDQIGDCLKKETFLGEHTVWDEFCERLQSNLTEWTLEEMEKRMGLEQMEALDAQELNTLFHECISENLSVNEEFNAKYTNLVNQYISVWVEEIMISLNIRSYSTSRIEALLAIQPSSYQPQEAALPRTKHAAFTLPFQDYLYVMNNAAYQYVREALYKQNFRKHKADPWPTAPLYKGNMEGVVQFRPYGSEGGSITEAWEQARHVADLDVDLFDALCGVFLSKARHSQELIDIHFDDLLSIRGLKAKLGGEGRRGGYEQRQRKQVLKSLTRIQSLWIELEKAIVYEKGRPVETKLKGRTFLFADSEGKECPISEFAEKKTFTFTVDVVFAKYLYGSGRQVALLPIQTLHYNPYRQTWEKRLARYFSWRWRTQARKGNFLQPNRISTLLESIGESMNHRTPSRTRDRLEKALDTLLEDGVIAAWHYEKWDEAIADYKGWARLWLNATLIIEPPMIIKEQYRSIERSRKEKAVPQAMQWRNETTASFGEQLRMARNRLHLSLQQLAKELEISPSYVSNIERGIRIPSPSVQHRIMQWLQRL
ncbi:MAG: helix-turn-helix domain-containing protein [Bacillus sp. (in: firmicutes)]